MKRIAAIWTLLAVLTAGHALAQTAWVSGGSLNVRAAPEQGAAVLGSLIAGAQVEVSPVDEAWGRVRLGEMTGYVMRAWLSEAQTAGTKRAVVSPYGTPTVVLRSRPSNSYGTAGILQTGESVELLGEFGGFLCVGTSAGTGFLSEEEVGR